MDYSDYNGLFKAYLDYDENIVWSQEPKIKLFKSLQFEGFKLIMGITLIIFGLLGVFGITKDDDAFEKRYGGLAFLIIGLFIFVKSFNNKKKYFAVTDKRIFILVRRKLTCVELKDVKHVMFNCFNQLVVYTRLSDNMSEAVMNDYNSVEIEELDQTVYASGHKNGDSESVILAIKEKPEVVQEVKDIIIRQARFLQNMR